MKRCHALRGALELFDYDDAGSAASLVQLLLRCAFAPCFLRSPEGRRFVSSLFTLHAPLTRQLFEVVKEQLPAGRATLLDAYGDILFRAWRTAAGATSAEMERTVLGGLASASLTAQTPALATSCRRVLGAFLDNRAVPGVDAVLLRAYRPVLFRALSAANPAVRRNGAAALFAFFPLHDPDAAVGDTDALLARQAQAFADLLADDAPGVRAVAVSGVVSVLDSFYELIPPKTAAGYVHKLAVDLAHDSAAPAVRAAVASSLARLVVNPAAQALLQPLLPKLAHLGNDASPAVRSAFADVLLAVRGVRSIKFYDVMPLDAIHEWLATETDGATSTKLARVLVPTYVPGGATLAEAARRMLALAETQPGAAAAFARCAVSGALPGGIPVPVAHDLVALLATALAAAGPPPGESAAEPPAQASQGGRKKRRAKDADAAAPLPGASAAGALPPALWEAVAKTVAALCDGIASQRPTRGAGKAPAAGKKTKAAAIAADEDGENEDGNAGEGGVEAELPPWDDAILAALRCAPTPAGQAAILRAGTCLTLATTPGSSAGGRKTKASSACLSLAAHCRSVLRGMGQSRDGLGEESQEVAVRMLTGLCVWGGAAELCDQLVMSLSTSANARSAPFPAAVALQLAELAIGDPDCRAVLLSCTSAADLVDSLVGSATAALESGAPHAEAAVRAAGKAVMHAALLRDDTSARGVGAAGSRECALTVTLLLTEAQQAKAGEAVNTALALAAECTLLGLLMPATPPAVEAAAVASAALKDLPPTCAAVKHATMVAALATAAA